MSITALSMISRAMRLARVKGVDQTPTAQEAADGLYALNSMLDSWSIEGRMVYKIDQNTHSWGAGVASRTIGSGGNFNTTRPIHIERDGNFFRTAGGLDYPVVAMERESYDLMTDKTSEGSTPNFLFYDGGFPTRTLYASPIPGEALTLYLNTWKPLQQFTSLTTQIALPAGYQATIEYNLAVWIAPEYGAAAVAAVSGNVERMAAVLKQAIRNVNTPNTIARSDVPVVGRNANIYSDT